MVPLSPGMEMRLRHPGPDPEAALIEREEAELLAEPRASRSLRLDRVFPPHALAIDWWLLGLSQREIASWFGCSQPRVAERIRVGIAQLRAVGK